MKQDSTERIVAGLRSWISDAPPGSQVPSNRALTAQYAASPVTVQKAMRRLAALGLVEARPGVGTFVRAVHDSRPADYGWQTGAMSGVRGGGATLPLIQREPAPDAIGMQSGYPARELLPERLVRAALSRAARSSAAVSGTPSSGLPELQSWFAGELAAFVPAGIAPPSARDALITSGSQSGISSIFRSLVGRGQPLVIESPTYWGAIVAAEQAGIEMIPVPSGSGGPDPDALERAFVDSGARAFYAQPGFGNPTGGSWDRHTATAVLDIIRRRGAFLIEDDWARDLGIHSPPPPIAAADEDGHVLYLRSLTKSVSPALRVAAVIARGPARERILTDLAAETMYVSGLLQAAALDVVTQPGWRSHLRSLREQLRDRRDALMRSLGTHAPSVHVEVTPRGGPNLWVRLPDGADVALVVRECASRGLVVAAGSEWFPAEPAGPYLRLNFARADPNRFPDAARILHETLIDLAT